MVQSLCMEPSPGCPLKSLRIPMPRSDPTKLNQCLGPGSRHWCILNVSLGSSDAQRKLRTTCISQGLWTIFMWKRIKGWKVCLQNLEKSHLQGFIKFRVLGIMTPFPNPIQTPKSQRQKLRPHPGLFFSF